MGLRLVIFDCDGTLIDTQHSIILPMKKAFKELSLPEPDSEDIKKLVGLSLEESLKRLCPSKSKNKHDELVDLFRRIQREYHAKSITEDPIFPGIEDVLDDLEEEGFLLGIATGKGYQGLKLALEPHDLLERFSTVQTADRSLSKPHPHMIYRAVEETGVDLENTVIIGDTTYDMEMANNAQIKSIGVVWGYHERSSLLRSGADYIAEQPDDLYELVLDCFRA